MLSLMRAWVQSLVWGTKIPQSDRCGQKKKQNPTFMDLVPKIQGLFVTAA